MAWYYEFNVPYNGFDIECDYLEDIDIYDNEIDDIKEVAVRNVADALCKKFNISIYSDDGAYEYTLMSPTELDISEVRKYIETAPISGKGTIEAWITPVDEYGDNIPYVDDVYEEVDVEIFVDRFGFNVARDQDELRALENELVFY